MMPAGADHIDDICSFFAGEGNLEACFWAFGCGMDAAFRIGNEQALCRSVSARQTYCQAVAVKYGGPLI